MPSGTPIDDRLRSRILKLRQRVTVDGRPLSYQQIAKLLGVSRQTVMAVCSDAMACRT